MSESLESSDRHSPESVENRDTPETGQDTAASVPAPAPAPAPESAPESAAADGEDVPQGPPAPDEESGTDGAGGNAPAEGGAEAPAKKPARRRRIAAVSGVAVLVAAVVGGIGLTAVTVQGADRDAGRPVWHLPKAGGAEAKAVAPTGLAAVLVPYDGEWTPGPDLAQFGFDTQLGGAEATALRKESLRGLPRTQRKRMERLIDEQHIKGMAMRSYLLDNSDYTDDRHSATVSIVLSQLEDQAAVKDASRFQTGFMDALGIFRKGPTVKGYKNAKCFLPPKDAEEKLDAMVCSAYEGDVLVTVNASGPKTMATGDIARLLETQLHRIKEPGKSV